MPIYAVRPSEYVSLGHWEVYRTADGKVWDGPVETKRLADSLAALRNLEHGEVPDAEMQAAFDWDGVADWCALLQQDE